MQAVAVSDQFWRNDGILCGSEATPAALPCAGPLRIWQRRLAGEAPCGQKIGYGERSRRGAPFKTRSAERITIYDLTCRTDGENHAHSVALFAMYYNFVRIHKTLRTTPAMAAGVTSRLWEIGDIVDVLEAWEVHPQC